MSARWSGTSPSLLQGRARSSALASYESALTIAVRASVNSKPWLHSTRVKPGVLTAFRCYLRNVRRAGRLVSPDVSRARSVIV